MLEAALGFACLLVAPPIIVHGLHRFGVLDSLMTEVEAHPAAVVAGDGAWGERPAEDGELR